MATFSGEFIHPELFTMAAAYLFHIVSNHPFVDGNKRTGLLAALVFLDLNDVSVLTSSEALYDLTMDVAQGRAGKELIASRIRQIAGEG
jgi:death-on-curing protein